MKHSLEQVLKSMIHPMDFKPCITVRKNGVSMIIMEGTIEKCHQQREKYYRDWDLIEKK